MTFLTPWAFAFLALLPVIILLYLLKVRRKNVTVSTLFFWQGVLEEHRRRALFQRLRNLLSLLLHLLIFLLILFALARPEVAGLFRGGASTVLVLDSRARMHAMEDGGTRFQAAKRMAAAYVRRASSINQIALVRAHAAPEIAAPFTGDPASLEKRLNELEATHAAGDLDEALELAHNLLESRKGATRVVVFTSEIPGETAAIEEWVAVGTARDNVGITTFAARPMPNSPQTFEVLLHVANFGRSPALGEVQIELEDQLIDVRPYELEPDGVMTAVFPIASDTPGGQRRLTARLAGGDALAVDDVAYASLPPPVVQRVLLVSDGDWFLENLLRADELVQFELLSPADFRPELAGAFDAVIVDHAGTADYRPFPEAGNWLFLGINPFGETMAAIEEPLLTEVDEASPLLRLVNLQSVTFVRARPVTPPDGNEWRATLPIQTFEQPLAVAAERLTDENTQRVAILGFGTGDSDLPLRTAFPLLMSNTIQWLSGATVAGSRSIRAGETVSLDAGESVGSAPRGTSDGDSELITNSFAPLENGLYRFKVGDQTSWLAVNTFSPAESDLRTALSSAPASEATAPLAIRSMSAWPIWFYLALAALVLFTLEWFLYHRRKTE